MKQRRYIACYSRPGFVVVQNHICSFGIFGVGNQHYGHHGVVCVLLDQVKSVMMGS